MSSDVIGSSTHNLLFEEDSLIDAVGPKKAESRLLGTSLLSPETSGRVTLVLIDITRNVVQNEDDNLVLVSQSLKGL